jgi:hypothetical protein
MVKQRKKAVNNSMINSLVGKELQFVLLKTNTMNWLNKLDDVLNQREE